jgi:hypothetical protein
MPMRVRTHKDVIGGNGRGVHGLPRPLGAAARAAVLMGVLALLAPMLLPGAVSGQGSNLPRDVTVKVVNGTTREPGRAATVSLLPLQSGVGALETAVDVVGEVTFEGLVLESTREYVAEAIAEGVPYYARATGQELENRPLTVYVFETTTALDSLEVAGMNLVLRRGEDELQLEYLFTITNAVVPQRTVLPSPATLTLPLPSALAQVQVEVLNRPAPVAVSTAAAAQEGWTGQTQLRLRGRLPYNGEAEITVGTNLAVTQWSVLAFPPDLEVLGEGLASVTTDTDADYSRTRGPALEAGQTLVLQVHGGKVPVVLTELAGKDTTTVAAPVAPPPLRDEKTSSVVLILVCLALVLIYLLVRMRRRS